MIDLVYCLTNVLFFGIPLIYYYFNRRSSITFCPVSGDKYLSLSSSLSCSVLFISFITVSELFCGENLTAASLPIKWPVGIILIWKVEFSFKFSTKFSFISVFCLKCCAKSYVSSTFYVKRIAEINLDACSR